MDDGNKNQGFPDRHHDRGYLNCLQIQVMWTAPI
jgi:hypothetical protein